jgi:hypothetical protein
MQFVCIQKTGVFEDGGAYRRAEGMRIRNVAAISLTTAKEERRRQRERMLSSEDTKDGQ